MKQQHSKIASILLTLLLTTIASGPLAAQSNQFNTPNFRFGDFFFFASSPAGGRPVHPGFGYRNPFPPNQFPRTGAQRPMQAQTWNAKDVQVVAEMFNSLLAEQELKPLFASIYSRQQMPILRFAKYPGPAPKNTACENTTEKKGGVYLWVQPPPHPRASSTIGISDHFFDTVDRTEEIDNERATRFSRHAALHELIHVYDFKQFVSRNQQFIKNTGWEMNPLTKEWTNKNMDYQMLAQLKEGFCNEVGDANEAGKAIEDYAIAMGFPSSYSLENPQEFFAEIVTEYYLNPDSRELMRPEFIAWAKSIL